LNFSIINFKEILANKPNITIKINGCGAYGVYANLERFGFQILNICCDYHDYCYQNNCNISKKLCDTDFKICLNLKCEKDYLKNQMSNYFTRYFRNISNVLLPIILKMYFKLFILNDNFNLIACRSIKKVMENVVDTLGCPAFIMSKSKNCECKLKKND